MPVTQKQIADKLNVSRSLVGRTLNGGGKVSADLRERIFATARELGYDPDANSAARSMISRRHNKPLKKGTIAMLFHFLGSSPRSMPFYIPFLEGVEEEAAGHESTIFFCLLRSGELPQLIRERNVDGVILLGDLPYVVADIKSLGLPLVTFHTQYEGLSCVLPDDFDGARQAIRHLYQQGHRHIGFMGVDSLPGRRRYEGYLHEMQACGLEVRDEWAVTEYAVSEPTADSYCRDRGHCDRCAACCNWDRLTEKSTAAGAELPTAMVCHNDLVAMGIAEHAGRDGVAVPADLSLVGFDDLSLQYDFEPAITSVVLPLHEMGQSAVRLLSDLETGQPFEASTVVLPVNLVVRDTTPALQAAVQ